MFPENRLPLLRIVLRMHHHRRRDAGRRAWRRAPAKARPANRRRRPRD